jgi:hypothetical protein
MKSVNNKGEATIEFSDNVVIPANFTKFNYLFLQVKLIPSEGIVSGSKKKISNWRITDFTKDTMVITVNFTDPMVIS